MIISIIKTKEGVSTDIEGTGQLQGYELDSIYQHARDLLNLIYLATRVRIDILIDSDKDTK